ncbi:MAG: sigma factor-like helix-turn-helix DNA-binding protein [Patescibacteria group bacterium]|nr:sigma factor-like helix-turn-helix DNA-binding protein [Patescibacteria group bacterium]
MLFNYKTICKKVLNCLPQKQKEVILRRFGLREDQKETLERIGQDFGITRERVRQIQNDGFKLLEEAKKERELEKVFSYFQDQLKNYGGLKREDLLLESLARQKFQNYVYFLLTLGDPFHRFSETEDTFSFWTIEKNIFQEIKEIIKKIFEKFEKEKRPLPEEHLLGLAESKDPKVFLSSLEIAKKIGKGPLNQFGLVSWPEINPKRVKDKAYLVLKKEARPLHFLKITESANKLEGMFFQNRQVLPATLHNELIKDPRFILVGRGIYALGEWGFKPGTVKDIILRILREEKTPLSRQEIVEKVLTQRLVKENTILLNLNNKKYFLKDSQGRYKIRRA